MSKIEKNNEGFIPQRGGYREIAFKTYHFFVRLKKQNSFMKLTTRKLRDTLLLNRIKVGFLQKRLSHNS